MILVALNFFVAIVALLQFFLADVSGSGLPTWVFFVLPVLTGTKSLFYWLKKPYHWHNIPNYLIIGWAILGAIYHAFYLNWTIFEILFLVSLTYAGIEVSGIKTANLVSLIMAVVTSLLIIFHTYIKFGTSDLSYDTISGTISLVGTLGVLLFLKFYKASLKSELESLFENEQNRSRSVINLLMSLGHSLRTPLASLRMRTEIMALTNEKSETVIEINEEIDGILKLFKTFEKAVKLKPRIPDFDSLVDQLDQRIQTSIIKIDQNPIEISSTDFIYFSAILNILVDNAITHGSGEQHLYIYQKDGGNEYAVENSGDYFQPNAFRDAMGRFTPDISDDNNRIGTSVITVFALCEALEYEVEYLERLGGGTRVEIKPKKAKKTLVV